MREISPLKLLLLTKKFKLLYLDKEHHIDYFTQIQVAIGLAGLKWCHFVAYIYKGMIIAKADSDRDYFKSIIGKWIIIIT